MPAVPEGSPGFLLGLLYLVEVEAGKEAVVERDAMGGNSWR